ncbi:carbonic anhydrase family protein [Listeria sp. PSOL-1]|uniref:carbonic anhydrase family protein n=1 Tax=Listeria sp. PSOL-1 TaxID=1844999 RepID=UPI0013D550F3|nr:carbonic anhydrase family protein [Listeria sp. PSOL-1]
MKNNKVRWAYQGETGPENWGHICSDYKIASTGERQSPINIKKQDIKKLTGQNIITHYHEMPYEVKRIENSVHLFPLEKTQSLVYNDTTYILQAFHAHIPSEHLLNNTTFPIEWHFVHQNEQGEMLVLGVFMEITANVAVSLGELPRFFSEVFQDFTIAREIKLDIDTFLPKEKAFFTYQGSLTTPPTVENVTWLLLTQQRSLAADTFSGLEKIIGGTNRPVQALNGREIIFYEE